MTVRGFQLNRFERVLFWTAVGLAGVLVAVRIGTAVALTFFHHAR